MPEIGLPAHAIPLALLFFNIGVELGQLTFVAAVLAFWQVLQSIALRQAAWTNGVAAYVLGGVATYWTSERIAGFWG